MLPSVLRPHPVALRRNRDFILLQVGQTLSTIGSESAGIAYPLLVLAVTHSPAWAGVVGFARIVPWAVVGFFAGVAVDRFPRRRLMIWSDVLRAAAVASIVVTAAFGSLSLAQIAGVAFVEGAMFVLFNVAEFGALRSVVATHQLPDAAAAEQARYSTVGLAAPPLGGFLFGLGRSLPFLADAVSYVFSLVSLLAIRTPFQEERDPTEGRVLADLAEGFRFLWGQRFLRTCALLAACTNIAFEAVFLILVVVGRRQGLSGAQIGALLAALGAGSLIGSAAAPWLARVLSMRALLIASFWVPLGIAVFIVRPSVYVLVAGSLPVAFVVPAVSAVVIGYRVAVVPDRLTGRVNGVARTIALLGAPLGPLAAGLMLGVLGERTVVAVFTGLIVVLALVGTASPSIRRAPSLSEIGGPPTGTTARAVGG